MKRRMKPMILILMKPMKMIPKKVTMTRVEKPKVFHRDFLGAHRYTTRGCTERPAGGVLRIAVVCRGQPRGDIMFPLRCIRTYPYVYFALGKVLKSRASPGEKSVCRSCQLWEPMKERWQSGG